VCCFARDQVFLGQRSLPVAEYKDGEVHKATFNLRDAYGLQDGDLGSITLHFGWDAKALVSEEKSNPNGFHATRAAFLARDTKEVRRTKEEEAARQRALARAEQEYQERLAREAEERRLAAEAAAAEAERQRVLAEEERKRAMQEARDEAERQRLRDEAAAAVTAAEEAKRQAEAERKQREAEAARMRAQAEAARVARAAAAAAAAAAMEAEAAAAAAAEEARIAELERIERETHLIAGRDFNVQSSVNAIRFGFQWDSNDYDDASQTWLTVDLDASAVILDAKGAHIDTCYFGQLSALQGAVTHSGDTKVTGTSSDDVESITLNLPAMPANAHTVVFVVSSFCCADMSKVDGFSTNVYTDGKAVGNIAQPGTSNKNYNALTLGRITRKSNGWVIQVSGDYTNFRAFNDSIGAAQRFCSDLFSNPPYTGIALMAKNESKSLDGVDHITIGLGWESSVDLDASLVTMDAKGDWKEKIFYNKYESDDKTIIHNGDNRQGDQDGDDETIDVKLSEVDSKITALGVCITINTKGKHFGMVESAYVRVLSRGRELMRFSLSDLDNCTAYVVAIIHRGCEHHRDNTSWSMTAEGLSGYGKSVSYCVEAMQGMYLHHMNGGTGPATEAFPDVLRFTTPANAKRGKKKG
jgi:stress response protein SCP2